MVLKYYQIITAVLIFLTTSISNAEDYTNNYSSDKDKRTEGVHYYFNAHGGYDYSTISSGSGNSYFGGPAYGGAIEIKVKTKEVAFGMKGGITISDLKNNANDEFISESFKSTSIFMVPKIYVGKRMYLGVGLRLAPSSLSHTQNKVSTEYKYLAYGITTNMGMDFGIDHESYFVISPEIKYDFTRLQPLNAASPERRMNSIIFLLNFQLML